MMAAADPMLSAAGPKRRARKHAWELRIAFDV
jgi:hypothetical protein